MKDHDQVNKVAKGALLLTVAGVLSKLLSAAYRIPLQNLTGDIGFYTYQQVYPILGMILILALYGFPSAISRMAVINQGNNRKLSLTHFAMPLFLLLLLINGLLALLLWLNAQRLANLIGDAQLASAFKMTAFLFLLIPLTSLFRGIFQSQLTMRPIALSQISEQLVRVIIILLAAILYATGRLTNIYKIAEGAAIAALGGAGMALVILAVILRKSNIFSKESFVIPWKNYLYTVVVVGLVASLNHMILLLIQLADTLTLIPALQQFGLSKLNAMAMKGVFDRGQPLIQLGTVIGSSFALSLIPAATKNRHHKNRHQTNSMTETLTLSFYLAMGATVGLVLIFPETNLLLFKDLSGTFSLQVLALATILSTVAVTAIAVLQGEGVVLRTALYIIIAFIVKGVSNLLLVPNLGITGSALATVLSLFVLMILVMYELNKFYALRTILRSLHWLSLVKAITAMASYILILKYFLPVAWLGDRLILLFYVVFVVMSGSLIYLIVLAKNRALTTEQRASLPFSRFLNK